MRSNKSHATGRMNTAGLQRPVARTRHQLTGFGSRNSAEGWSQQIRRSRPTGDRRPAKRTSTASPHGEGCMLRRILQAVTALFVLLGTGLPLATPAEAASYRD